MRDSVVSCRTTALPERYNAPLHSREIHFDHCVVFCITKWHLWGTEDLLSSLEEWATMDINMTTANTVSRWPNDKYTDRRRQQPKDKSSSTRMPSIFRLSQVSHMTRSLLQVDNASSYRKSSSLLWIDLHYNKYSNIVTSLFSAIHIQEDCNWYITMYH